MASSTWRSASFALLLLPLPFLLASSASANDLTAQVWSLCGTTPFPDLCYKTTAALSPLVADNFTTLVRSLLGVCLDSAKAAAGYVKSAAADGGDSSPVRGCVKRTEDAVEMLGLAAKEVDRLGRPGSQQYARCLDAARILTTTAVSDADGCIRALVDAQKAGAMEVPREMKERVLHSMQMTSIAVVFVSSLVPKN